MRPTDLQFKRPDQSAQCFYNLNTTCSQKGVKFSSEKRFQPLPNQKLSVGPGSYNIDKSDVLFKRANSVKIIKPILSSKMLKFERFGDVVACEFNKNKYDLQKIQQIKVQLIRGDKNEQDQRSKNTSATTRNMYDYQRFKKIAQNKQNVRFAKITSKQKEWKSFCSSRNQSPCTSREINLQENLGNQVQKNVSNLGIRPFSQQKVRKDFGQFNVYANQKPKSQKAAKRHQEEEFAKHQQVKIDKVFQNEIINIKNSQFKNTKRETSSGERSRSQQRQDEQKKEESFQKSYLYQNQNENDNYIQKLNDKSGKADVFQQVIGKTFQKMIQEANKRVIRDQRKKRHQGKKNRSLLDIE